MPYCPTKSQQRKRLSPNKIQTFLSFHNFLIPLSLTDFLFLRFFFSTGFLQYVNRSVLCLKIRLRQILPQNPGTKKLDTTYQKNNTCLLYTSISLPSQSVPNRYGHPGDRFFLEKSVTFAASVQKLPAIQMPSKNTAEKHKPAKTRCLRFLSLIHI